MGHPPGAAFDVGVLGRGAGRGAQVALKAGAVFAQIVPQPGDMRPVLGAEAGRVADGAAGDPEEMAAQQVLANAVLARLNMCHMRAGPEFHAVPVEVLDSEIYR